MTSSTLVVLSRDSGFFSNFNCVMSNLEYFLGKDGCVAAEVQWTRKGEYTQFAYGSGDEGNIWLKLFEPLQFSFFPDTRFEVADFPTKRVNMLTGKDAYAVYRLSQTWRGRYNRLYKDHVRVRAHITSRVDEIFERSMVERYCVGVHYRNPEQDVECLFPKPRPEEFARQALALIPHNRKAAVFLATDYEPAITVFRDVFGDRLVMQDQVTRSIAGGQVHHDAVSPSVALAEQVLVDCLLLARCDALVHVTSNVATTAGYINPRLKMIYCESCWRAFYGFFWSVLKVIRWYLLYIPALDRLYRLLHPSHRRVL